MKRIQSFIFFLSLCCCLPQKSLHSEIQEVTVFWTAFNCQQGCANLLIHEFSKVYGVQEVKMNGPMGQATLIWKPNIPFAFQPVDAAMRMVGPRTRAISVKVRGVIRHQMNIVKLISEGDGTEFYLLSPITPNLNQQVLNQSVFNHQLTPELLSQLLQIEQTNKTVIIEGPLFQPNRSPPNQLIVENINIEESK